MTFEEHIEKIRSQLSDRKLQVVADNIGVSYQTMLSFSNSKGQARIDVLIKLDNYLNRESTDGKFDRNSTNRVGSKGKKRSSTKTS